jgi:hypothetical protein
LNPPKKKDTVSVVDESEKPQSPEKLYRGEISKNGKRFFTSDETLFLFCRSAMAGILQRYCDGDQRLCEEVEENRRMGKRKSYEMFANNVIQNAEGKVAKKDHEMPTANYVYATKSPAFPGLIKIGKTIDVAKRLSSLNTSCAPAPHVIVAVAPSFDNQRDEETAHTFFASARREGEFFELEDEVVKNYFATHITSQ